MDPAPHSIPQPGELIGPYRVLGELGRGGMATVLEVEHADTGARRALKLMLPVARADEVARRMEREFQTLSRLDHPSVLKVYEAGLYQRRPWFVMEVLEGEELGVAVEHWRALPPAQRFARAEEVLTRVAEALACIHDQGLVHRDVTPSNVMLLRDGGVRLMDFGLAKIQGAEQLTQVGMIAGSPSYIAPEIWKAEEFDHRVDVYALGAVVFRCLTGQPPFTAPTTLDLFIKATTEERPRLTALRSDLPPEIDAWIARALALRRDDRYPYVSSMWNDLISIMMKGSSMSAEKVRATFRLPG